MRVGAARGFSLIEVVVASALLLLACVAVSGALGTALKANASVACRGNLEAVADEVCERLDALPFWRPVASAACGDVLASPTSLVAQVFPHARLACNTAAAFYCDAAAPSQAGSFVGVAMVQGVRVRTAAVFLATGGAGITPRPVSPALGWAVWADESAPPATMLAVTVEASQAGQTVTRHMELTEARPSVEAGANASPPAPREALDG